MVWFHPAKRAHQPHQILSSTAMARPSSAQKIDWTQILDDIIQVYLHLRWYVQPQDREKRSPISLVSQTLINHPPFFIAKILAWIDGGSSVLVPIWNTPPSLSSNKTPTALKTKPTCSRSEMTGRRLMHSLPPLFSRVCNDCKFHEFFKFWLELFVTLRISSIYNIIRVTLFWFSFKTV